MSQGSPSHDQRDTIPMQQYNPAFQDMSLERRGSASLPLHGTQYQFAHYGHPDRPADIQTAMQMEGPHIFQRSNTTGRPNRAEGQKSGDDIENLLKRLPSRQLDQAATNAAKTLQRRKKSMRRNADDPNDLDDMIDQAFDLDVEEEEKMEEAIRSTPATMATRRSMIKKLSSRKRKAPGFVKRMKYSIGMSWKHAKDKLAELKYTMQLWHSHLKRIEGNFGTDVLSYFLFLKWLLLINIPTLLLTLGFIVVPQILYRWLQQDPPGYTVNGTEAFSGLELLTGAGWFAPTELYYGYYTNNTINIIGDKNYKMQVAYLFTCGGYYLLTLVILGQSILSSYRKYYIEAIGHAKLDIVFKLLGSWDFGITSPEAVRLKHKSVHNEIKEYLAGVDRSRTHRSLSDRCKLFWLRAMTNLVALALIGGSGYLVYYLSQLQLDLTLTSSNTTQTSATSVAQDDTKNPLLLLVLPLCIGGIHLLLPLIFNVIEGFEQYASPKNELYIHLTRSMVLRLGTLTVLVVYWYIEVRGKVECWETFMGQELYRLVIIDFIFNLFSTFFTEFVRSFLAGRSERLQHPTFSIARNTLELIYSQALCWLGTFYAPLLSLIVIIKMIFVFYVKMVSVLKNCKPSDRRWRATRSHTIFLGFLFIFFIVTSAAVAVGIIFVKPSSGCGPYQGKDVMYSVVPELVDSWREDHQWLSSTIRFVSSPGFIASILIALGMGVYLIRTIMLGRKETVHRLKQQLVMEGKDKAFLLNLLNQVSQHQNVQHGTSSSHERRLTPHMQPSDVGSPGGRVFVRRIAESAVVAK